MPNLNYNNGVAKERRIVNSHRNDGCIAFRSAGSHSPIDVVVIDNQHHRIKLIQCKPKSMSSNARSKLLSSLSHLDGQYLVECSVV